jgi:hypothetical protein
MEPNGTLPQPNTDRREGQTPTNINPGQSTPAGNAQPDGGSVIGQPQPSWQQATPSQPGSFGAVSGAAVSPRTGGKKRKLTLLIAGMAVLLIGSGAAAYYGVLVPNKPENLWKTALDRTAIAYDTLVTDSNQKFKDAHGITAKGDYKLEGSFATDGTLELQTYDQNAMFKFDVGVVGTRVNVEGRLLDAANSSNPDVYVKASGLKSLSGLAGDDYGQMLTELDNKWIGADHTFLDTIESMALKEGAQSTDESLTTDDMTQIYKAVGEVNRQYLLTTDPNKAVLTIAERVGAEEQDGRSVYHFKVGLHKQHTKDYVNALVDRLQTTPLKKVLGEQKLADIIDKQQILKTIDEYKESDTADVYVDKGTKLIRTIRITDKKDNKEYVEIKIPYTGGNDIPAVVTLSGKVDESSDKVGSVVFNLNTNTDTGDGKLKVRYDFPAADANSKRETGTVNVTMNINNTKLNLQKPTDVTPVTELFGGLFSGLEDSSSGALFDGSAVEL